MDICPMVGLDKINGKVVGKSWIHGNVAPSRGDVAFVKKWYPWESEMKALPKADSRLAVGVKNG